MTKVKLQKVTWTVLVPHMGGQMDWKVLTVLKNTKLSEKLVDVSLEWKDVKD